MQAFFNGEGDVVTTSRNCDDSELEVDVVSVAVTAEAGAGAGAGSGAAAAALAIAPAAKVTVKVRIPRRSRNLLSWRACRGDAGVVCLVAAIWCSRGCHEWG